MNKKYLNPIFFSGLTVPAGSGKNGSGVDKSALERPALESQAPYFPG